MSLNLDVAISIMNAVDSKHDFAAASSVCRLFHEAALRRTFEKIVFYVDSGDDHELFEDRRIRYFGRYTCDIRSFVRRVTIKPGANYLNTTAAIKRFEAVMDSLKAKEFTGLQTLSTLR